MVKSKKKKKSEATLKISTLSETPEVIAVDPKVNAQPKNLSSSVQKLRFMRIAEHGKDKKELQLKQKNQISNLQWFAEGYADTIRQEIKQRSNSSKKIVWWNECSCGGSDSLRLKMGFLEVGTPIRWIDSTTEVNYVKLHGIKQLLHIWKENRDRYDEELRWGEEVDDGVARIYSDATEMLETLGLREHLRPRPPSQISADWHPEFSNHMIEAIPSPPYILNLNSILILEPSMRVRRAKIQSVFMASNKFVMSTTTFPRFGLSDFISPVPENLNPETSIAQSIFIPDEIINPHPRFGTLVKNIIQRRGAKPFIKIPIYKDKYTGFASSSVASSSVASSSVAASSVAANAARSGEGDWSLARSVDSIDRFEVQQLARKTLNPVKDFIYMDSFAFGMAMSCVQATFTCSNLSSARYLYDQLVVLGPLFLALTAATPFQRGLLSDFDTRWSTLEQAVDCRTAEEEKFIPKSRYSAVSKYLSEREPLKSRADQYNDSLAPINEDAFKLLIEGGMDELLASHFAHLWLRDPMVIFAEKVHLDDTKAVDHFENIQSTNWNSVRFKPPPPPPFDQTISPIGWRVEFRSPDIQLTDFENAATVALLSVLAQAILALDLDLYIPMSLNDLNMRNSWTRDAITKQKFYFRKIIMKNSNDCSVVKLTLEQIFCGDPRAGVKGLIPLCLEFMDSDPTCDVETKHKFKQYTALLIDRVSGRKWTCAKYMRQFVLQHPAYKQDSIIPPVISYDLCVLATNIGFGIWGVPELFGTDVVKQTPLPASTVLPELSAEGRSTIRFSKSFNEVCNQPYKEKELNIVVKRTVLLNDMSCIYTLPMGTAIEFPYSCFNDDPIGNQDRLNLSYIDLVSFFPMKQISSGFSGAVSSEDFTRSWLSKGPDSYTPSNTIVTSRHKAWKQLLLRWSLCKDHSCSCSKSSDKRFEDWDCQQTPFHMNLADPAISTICPSTTASCAWRLDDELICELTRGFNVGFDTEEELEYFKQVSHCLFNKF